MIVVCKDTHNFHSGHGYMHCSMCTSLQRPTEHNPIHAIDFKFGIYKIYKNKNVASAQSFDYTRELFKLLNSSL
jgi:hypothetical protein